MAKTAEKPRSSRFIGWQETPIHQATFGRSTKGGGNNVSFKLLKSTGPVQSYEGHWYLIDASEAPVGRVATVIASILSGKSRPSFTPGASSAESVIVINAGKAYFTANKAEKKIYYRHTMYMGGLKSRTAKEMLNEKPEEVIWLAVQGMLPKNKISRYQLARLKVYKGAEHSHQAQKPIQVSVKGRGALMKIARGA